MSDFTTLVIRAYKIKEPNVEYRFHGKRKWRFDYAWPDQKVAVEIEGGVFSGGRHTRGHGYLKDCEKYNAAQELGWIVLRYAPGKVDYEQVKRVLQMRDGDNKKVMK